MDSLEIETSNGLQRIALEQTRLTIGRLPGNDIVLPFLQISRHHAELRRRGDDWWIIDIGSKNGLSIKGKRIQEYRLSPDDRITLAPTIALIFRSQSKPKDVTVEGTVQLPAVQIAPAPAYAPSTVPAEPIPVDHLASAVSMPMPRREFVGRGGAAVPGTAPPMETEDPNRQTLPAAMVPPPPTTAEISRGGRDLPIQTPFSLQRQQMVAANHTQHLKKPILYLCPTCGERTAPDSPYCWNCRHAIAQPCRTCQMYLLPIQAKCPRCHASNPHSVR